MGAEFCEDRAVNTRENMRRTFALYIYNMYGTHISQGNSVCVLGMGVG